MTSRLCAALEEVCNQVEEIARLASTGLCWLNKNSRTLGSSSSPSIAVASGSCFAPKTAWKNEYSLRLKLMGIGDLTSLYWPKNNSKLRFSFFPKHSLQEKM